MTEVEIVAHVAIDLAVTVIVGTVAYLRGYDRGSDSVLEIFRKSMEHSTRNAIEAVTRGRNDAG